MESTFKSKTLSFAAMGDANSSSLTEAGRLPSAWGVGDGQESSSPPAPCKLLLPDPQAQVGQQGPGSPHEPRAVDPKEGSRCLGTGVCRLVAEPCGVSDPDSEPRVPPEHYHHC